MKENMIKDTLYNCSRDCTTNGNHKVYARGIIVGVVGTVMAVHNCVFDTAVQLVVPYLPKKFDFGCLPESWEPEFEKHLYSKTS